VDGGYRLARFDRGQRVQARSVTEDSAVIEVSRHDRVQQRVTTQMIMLDGQGMHLRPVAIRYSASRGSWTRWPESARVTSRPLAFVIVAGGRV
jgi:hypothetical protein